MPLRRWCRRGLNESPELIAQEYGAGGLGVFASPASMKVLSLLLRNYGSVLGRMRQKLASMKVLSLLLRNPLAYETTSDQDHRLNESPELIAQEYNVETRP